MRISNSLALSTALLLANVLTAEAQTPPTAPGSAVQGPSYALQCRTEFNDATSGGAHQPAIADVDLRAKIPNYDALGFRMTGGGCEQYFGDVSGLTSGYVVRNAPIGDASWSCNISDQPGWPNQPDGGPRYRARAHAIACRVVKSPTPIGATTEATTLNGLDGTQRIVARDGIGFLKRIQQDLRLCNVKGPKLLARWNFAATEPPLPSWTVSDKEIAPGECIDMATPSAAMVQNQSNGASTVRWQWYRKGELNEGEMSKTSAAAPPAPAPEAKSYDCTDLSKVEQANNKNYSRKCPIKLEGIGNYRVCFPLDYVTRSDGDTTWALSLMDTVVEPSLVGRSVAGAYDPRWNAVVGGACRDYYNIRFLAALVGPVIPAVPWDAKKVLAVKASIEKLP